MRANRSCFVTLVGVVIGLAGAGCSAHSGSALPAAVVAGGSAGTAGLFVRGNPTTTVGGRSEAPPIWVGGELYGTTTTGGLHNLGGVYGLTSAKNAFSLHSFKVTGPVTLPLTYLNGVLYGTKQSAGSYGSGSAFGVDRRTGKEVFFYGFRRGSDASRPGLLTNAGDDLYATSNHGGSNAVGTIFEIDPSTGKEQVVYNFQNAADGRFPMPVLANAGGVLFGSTYDGENGTTIFSFDTSSNTFKVVYSFGSDDVEISNLAYANGKVFGDNYNGSNWTLYSLDPASGAMTTLATTPEPVIQLIAGGKDLYGTTDTGGKHGHGSLFRIDQSTGMFTTIYDFPTLFVNDQFQITFGDGKFYCITRRPGSNGQVTEIGQGYQKTLYTFQ